jgi:hypothetical protein
VKKKDIFQADKRVKNKVGRRVPAVWRNGSCPNLKKKSVMTSSLFLSLSLLLVDEFSPFFFFLKLMQAVPGLTTSQNWFYFYKIS